MSISIAVCVALAAFLCGYFVGRLRRPLLALTWLVVSGTAFAASPENQALALAVADLKITPELDRFYVRYIWVTAVPHEKTVWQVVHEDRQACDLTVNYWNSQSFMIKPLALGQGPLMLLKIDLRHFAANHRKDQLELLLKTWEEFRFDPKFWLLITRDTLKFLEVSVPLVKKTIQEKIKVAVKPYTWTDGKVYDWEYKTVNKVIEVPFEQSGEAVVRLPPDHVDQGLMVDAQLMTGSQAPVVNHRYMITRGLSTIDYGNKDNKAYKVIYGGLYYELSNMPRAKDAKRTDLDELFKSLGIANVDDFDDFRSDMAGILKRSEITDKRRKWRAFPTLTSLEHGQGLFVITDDLANADIDIGDDPLFNLLKTFGKPVHEGIFTKPNGLLGYTLHDGNGKLARSVPEDVAKDKEGFGTAELEPAIGCIRCHKKGRGWITLGNDVPKMFGKQLGIFDDTTKRNGDDNLNRIAGLYSGNIEKTLLPKARDSHAVAIYRATGKWAGGRPDQTDVVEMASSHLAKIYQQYKFEMVDAVKALSELGVEYKPGEQLKVIAALLPPIRAVRHGIVVQGIIPEDPRVSALKEGESINRIDWDLLYSFAASRVAKQAQEKRP